MVNWLNLLANTKCSGVIKTLRIVFNHTSKVADSPIFVVILCLEFSTLLVFLVLYFTLHTSTTKGFNCSLTTMETTTENALKTKNQRVDKLNRLDGMGTNFNCWKNKMMFFLTAFKVAYILDPSLPPIPLINKDDSKEIKQQRRKREDDEVIYHGHILDTLSNRVYDVYNSDQVAKRNMDSIGEQVRRNKVRKNSLLRNILIASLMIILFVGPSS